MSDTLTPQTPVVESQVVTPAPVTPERPVSEREQIYNKFYEANPETAITPQVVAPVVETPQTPATPVVEVPVSNAPVVNSQDEINRVLLEEIKGLKAQLAPKPITPTAPGEEADWLQLMAEGKKAEGEKALAKKIEAEMSQRIQSQAVAQMQAERQMYEFNTEIRQKNPDLLSMEDYISYGAQNRINAAAQAGKIQTPADYVTVYKEAVNAEVEKARKLAQSLRGAGKNEAIVRQSEVVSAQTLQPNPVTNVRETSNQPAEQVDSVEDYFAKRNAQSAAGRGMGR